MNKEKSNGEKKSMIVREVLIIVSIYAGLISAVLAFFEPLKGAALALSCIALTYTAKTLVE